MFKKLSTSLVIPSLIFGLSGFGFGAYQMMKPTLQSAPAQLEKARPAPAREQAKKDLATLAPIVDKANEDSMTQIYSYPSFQDLYRRPSLPSDFNKDWISALRTEAVAGRLKCDQPLAEFQPIDLRAITQVKCIGNDGLKIEAELPLTGKGKVKIKTSFGLTITTDPGN
jgi:hypothetical protein